jgi:hypothetical protein
MGKPLQLPYVTAEPIKRKSALGDRLLSLGIAPLRESPESPTAHPTEMSALGHINGHLHCISSCPLYPQKQTSVECSGMSAMCQ